MCGVSVHINLKNPLAKNFLYKKINIFGIREENMIASSKFCEKKI
jgi:hypothetical protein